MYARMLLMYRLCPNMSDGGKAGVKARALSHTWFGFCTLCD